MITRGVGEEKVGDYQKIYYNGNIVSTHSLVTNKYQADFISNSIMNLR